MEIRLFHSILRCFVPRFPTRAVNTTNSASTAHGLAQSALTSGFRYGNVAPNIQDNHQSMRTLESVYSLLPLVFLVF